MRLKIVYNELPGRSIIFPAQDLVILVQILILFYDVIDMVKYYN